MVGRRGGDRARGPRRRAVARGQDRSAPNHDPLRSAPERCGGEPRPAGRARRTEVGRASRPDRHRRARQPRDAQARRSRLRGAPLARVQHRIDGASGQRADRLDPGRTRWRGRRPAGHRVHPRSVGLRRCQLLGLRARPPGRGRGRRRHRAERGAARARGPPAGDRAGRGTGHRRAAPRATAATAVRAGRRQARAAHAGQALPRDDGEGNTLPESAARRARLLPTARRARRDRAA